MRRALALTTRTTPTEENLFELNKHGCTCIQQPMVKSEVFQISKNKQTLLTRNYTSLRTFKPSPPLFEVFLMKPFKENII